MCVGCRYQEVNFTLEEALDADNAKAVPTAAATEVRARESVA